MEKLFLELLNRSITAGWLVLAAVLVRLLFKRAPKWITGCLWVLVAVRLLIPFSLESVYSLIPTAETVPYEILYSEIPAIESGVPVIDEAVNPQLAESSVPTVGASVNPLQIVTAVSAYLWIAGLACMLTSAAVSYILLKRRVRTAVRLRENIRQSEYIETPFVLGIFRPTVYLPYDVEDTDVEYIIAHEKTHIRRGDHLVKPFAFALLSVYWFNPLMWAAYILLCRDIELACDEHVIENMSADERKAYSTVLLEFSTKQKLITACPVAFGEVGVKTRIKSVLNYKKPAFWVIVLALAVCVVCGVCLTTDPKPIDVLPEADEIAYIEIERVYYSNGNAHGEGAVGFDTDLEAFFAGLGTATKTYLKSWNDTPDIEKLDNGIYYRLTFHYADETASPSSSDVFLYSKKGNTCLMVPYDHVYRIDKEYLTSVTSAYHSEQLEETTSVYTRLTHEKLDVQQELEQQLTDHQKKMDELEDALLNEQGSTEELQAALLYEQEYTGEVMEVLMSAAREEVQEETSVQSSEYYRSLFEEIYQSIKTNRGWLWYTLPDAPEVPNLTVYAVGEKMSGGVSKVNYYGAGSNIDHVWKPGDTHQIPTDGLTELTLYLSVISADGLCEVEYDLMEFLKEEDASDVFAVLSDDAALSDPKAVIYEKMLNAIDYYNTLKLSFTGTMVRNSVFECYTDIDSNYAYEAEYVDGELVEETLCDGQNIWNIEHESKEYNTAYTSVYTREDAEYIPLSERIVREEDGILGYRYRRNATNCTFAADYTMFPQALAYNCLENFDNWKIEKSLDYLDRTCTYISGTLDSFNAERWGGENFFMLVDSETGVLMMLTGELDDVQTEWIKVTSVSYEPLNERKSIEDYDLTEYEKINT